MNTLIMDRLTLTEQEQSKYGNLIDLSVLTGLPQLHKRNSMIVMPKNGYDGINALVTGLQQKVEDSELKVKEKKDKILELRRSMADAQKTIEEMADEREEQKEKIEKLTEDNERLKAKGVTEEIKVEPQIIYKDKVVEPSDYEELKKAGQALNQVVVKKEELEKTVEELKIKIDDLEKTVAEYKKKAIEQGTNEKELKLLQKEHSEMAEALNQAMTQVANLQDETDKLQGSYDEVQRELEIEKADNDANKERAIAEVDNLNQKITDLREKLESITAEQPEIVVQEHSDSDYETLQKEYESYKGNHKHTDKEYEELLSKAKTKNQAVSKADDFLGSQEKSESIREKDREILRLQETIKQMQQQQVQPESKEEYQRKYALIEKERLGIRETLISIYMPTATTVPNHSTMLNDQSTIGQRYRALLKRRKLS